MRSSPANRSVSSLTFVLGPAGALLLAIGCSSSGGALPPGAGGATSSGGSMSNGGALAGGATGTGGTREQGGSTSTGGIVSSGGVVSSGGTAGSGTGGAAKGGTSGTGGIQGAGGTVGRDGGAGSDGAPGTGGTAIDAETSTVNCSAAMPTDGKTYTGSNVNGTANGLGYGIWTNGSGGSITVFSSEHAFAASWSNSQDFLAHLGLDFRTDKSYTAYGTIAAEFAETKTGTAGGFSMIGMYGWMHSPCVEWYINEDSFNGLNPRGNVTATIDGATYYLTTSTTTGTGGANACEGGHTGGWTQMVSTRKTARQCGTITVSDHFAAWAKQGWNLGTLSSVHINVETGGGTGSVQFPVANVTTTSN